MPPRTSAPQRWRSTDGFHAATAGGTRALGRATTGRGPPQPATSNRWSTSTTLDAAGRRALAGPGFHAGVEVGLGPGASERDEPGARQRLHRRRRREGEMLPAECDLEADVPSGGPGSRRAARGGDRGPASPSSGGGGGRGPDTTGARSASDPEHEMVGLLQENAEVLLGAARRDRLPGRQGPSVLARRRRPRLRVRVLAGRHGAADRERIVRFLQDVKVHTLSAFDYLWRR